MHTPNTPEQNPQNPHGLTPTGYNVPSPGYETSDVKVGGIFIFLVSLFVFLTIFFVFCFGMGKVINNALVKHDGPPNKWNTIASPPQGKGKNLESNAAAEQQQLSAMTARFPTPRLQMDDGDQDVVDLHAREDLLLDHYTWVNQQQGTVRIPIGQAMEIVAQRGLPVIPGAANQPAASEPTMTADVRPHVTVPLTNGFARTGYEQRLEVEQARQQQEQRREGKPGEQAQLAPPHP
jgi:Na+-transporting methylmalonyl-CoA/oxaloacetate decarboxylase gamma subunit